jgi:prepilin-type N-terminal cleavage/methylation domain-containing protein
MQKNAFTLIETIIVLSIIAILFLILSPNFKPINQNNKAHLCVQNIHQFLNKEIQNAIQTTSLTTSWVYITIDSVQQYIHIQDLWSWQLIEFPQDLGFFSTCRTTANIQLSWDKQTIAIQNQTIQPPNQNTFSHEIEFIQCEWTCIPLWKITIDTRIDRSHLHLCSYSWSICHYDQ